MAATSTLATFLHPHTQAILIRMSNKETEQAIAALYHGLRSAQKERKIDKGVEKIKRVLFERVRREMEEESDRAGEP